MADSELARKEIADPQVAKQVAEITEAAATASALARDFEIQVEVLGWTEPVAVPSPARPGAVRCAVEKVLRDLGPTTIPRRIGRALP